MSILQNKRGIRGRGRTVVGFTMTTNIVSSNLMHGWVYLIQHCVIKIVSDLRQVGAFFRVLPSPPPIKLRATK
jgi:hypothetical protein